jgi:hypothetical protein
MIRSIALFALVLGLAFAPRPVLAAHHEAVTQAVIVEVTPGKLEAYRAEVKKLKAVLARVGSKATLRVWETTAGGEDAGTVLVGIEYADHATWAADSAKAQADAEWQKIVAGLSGMRKVLSTAIYRDVSPNPPAEGASAGSVMVVTGVTVQPGKLEEYRTRVGGGQKIVERLGMKSRARMWQAEIAGPGTGSIAVATEYPDLATYVADQAKLTGDAEWQKLLSGLDGVRTMQGRWLYRDITP